MGGKWAMVLVLLLSTPFVTAPAVQADRLTGRTTQEDGEPPPPTTTESIPWGTAFSVEFTIPGQQASYTFEGHTDQVVTAVLVNSTLHGCWTTLSILSPQMNRVASVPTCNPTAALKHVRLPADGTYTLQVTPAGASRGRITLALYAVEDVVGAIPTDGTSVAVDLTTPGQLASLSFQGIVGQIVTAQLTNSTIPGCWTSLKIFGPDRRQVASASTCHNNALLAHKRLPADGTYTLELTPAGTATGQATLALYTVVDVGGSISSTLPFAPSRSYEDEPLPRPPSTGSGQALP